MIKSDSVQCPRTQSHFWATIPCFVMYPGLSTGAIVGIAAGCVVAAIVVMAAVAVMIVRRKRRIHPTDQTLPKIANSEHPDAEISSRRNSSRIVEM